MKKNIFGVLVLIIFAIIITSPSVNAITLKEFFEKPLPSTAEFVEKAIEWLWWFWSKIVYYAEIIFDWSLDNILINIWKFFVWLWNLIKNGIMSGWGMIDQIARMLASGSDIDWGSVQWPWE